MHKQHIIEADEITLFTKNPNPNPNTPNRGRGQEGTRSFTMKMASHTHRMAGKRLTGVPEKSAT